MSSVLRTLREGDPALLQVLAQVWGVRIEGMDTTAIIEAVAKAMLEGGRTVKVWDSLSDKERGAMHVLIASKGAKMPENQFSMVYGKIRKLSTKEIAREKPHEAPANTAEALYYRGLVGMGYETIATGPRQIVYVPEDLIKVLPTQKTSYHNLDDEEFDDSIYDFEDEDDVPTGTPEPSKAEPPAASKAVAKTASKATPSTRVPDDFPEDADDTESELDSLSPNDVQNVRAADTSIIDDMTTVLAYLRLQSPLLERDFFAQNDYDTLAPHLLIADHDRLDFILRIGVSARLIEVQNGRATPTRDEAPRWLQSSRAEQIKKLADAWKTSQVWVDLFHVPGLHPEPEAGTLDQYNPLAAREAIIDLINQLQPNSTWWPIEQFIDIMREEAADFQRPNGDFNSWYIRNEDGEYLNGIESWDAIEGALLEYVISGPLYWLGLLDQADDAARLTAYGRGFFGLTPFPSPPDPPDSVVVQGDGTILVSRKVLRFERFQISRFTTWAAPADLGGKPYTYKLDSKGITRAGHQGINVGHIGTLLSKYVNPLPAGITKLLQSWQGGAVGTVNFERVMIVRATSVEIMNQIVNTPATRRYLGARLGELAVIIRADQWEALRDALGEMGIQVEVNG